MKPEGRTNPKRIAFTKAALEALPLPSKGERRGIVYDRKIPKLACRITHAGRRTFYVITRTPAGMEWLQLGSLSDTTVEQARKKAAKVLGQFAEGKNPAQAKREAKAEMTAGDGFETYMKNHVEARGIKSAADLRQLWERCIGELPDAPRKKHARERSKHPAGVNWQSTKLSAITHEKVKALHAAIGRTHPIQANRAIELLSAMCNHLGIANPVSGLEPFKEQKRDRFLREAELPRFFAALAEDTSEDFRHFVTLSLLTGARGGNVRAMRWADIDFERAVWTVPAAQSKSGDPMDLPLVAEAIAILATRRERDPEAECVFSATSRSGHMTRPKKRWTQLFDRAELKEITARIAAAPRGTFKWKNDGTESLERALARARAEAAKLKVSTAGARLDDLRLHDLRRSLGSWQAILGASLPIIGKSLGHKSASATAIYARLHMDPVRASVEAATSAMLAKAGIKPRGKVLSMPKRGRKR